ncbi:hypothetical protein CBS101457_003151 [Exobasidium rhododendri]|nr:hypothetical protein CBS101457_003151 [Exobasidium rhododendri]
MSAPALAELSNVLQDSNAALDSRFRCLFALKGVASASPELTKPVITIIAKAFEDNDSALLKHELAYVLGQIQSEDAIECLEGVLKTESEHPMVRHEAAEALGAISSTKSLPILRHYLNDSNVSVRETCELALQKIEYDHAASSSSSSSTSHLNKKEESEGSALARAKVAAKQQLDHVEDDQLDSAFLPIDPAPAHSHQTQTLLSSIPLYQAQLTAGDSLPLFDRYRAMFSLRNAVHAAKQKSQDASIPSSKREEFETLALNAVLALAKGLSDKSALFRHEICFVFGELAHPGCVESMVKVLGDDAEEEMVRHEAAEALGAVVEEASGNDEEGAEGQEVNIVMKTLKEWATNEQAPRVVRESCLVALDEMAYNNDPTQFQPVPVIATA